MAKKIKFPLEMRDGVQARNIDELREFFDIEKALEYLIDGKLLTWLQDRYYMQEAESISKLDTYSTDVKERLCEILGVEMEVEAQDIDVEEIERRKEKLLKLKKYTDDEDIWNKVDYVAFDQEELADLLDDECSEIYLCDGKFCIPVSECNKKYIGIHNPVVSFSGDVSTSILREQKIELLYVEYEDNIINPALSLFYEFKWSEAVNELKSAAEKGDVESIYALEEIYSRGGDSISIDLEERNRWIQRGMDVGDVLSKIMYALYVEADKEQTKTICCENRTEIMKMAENNPMAADLLGLMYINNTDEDKNYVEANKWFEKAFDMGYIRSADSLGISYEIGRGVEKNLGKAMELYRIAAERGYANAQYNLSRAYYYGWNGKMDVHLGKEWAEKAYHQRGKSDIENKKKNLLNLMKEAPRPYISTAYYDVKSDFGYPIVSSSKKFSTEGEVRNYASERLYQFTQKLEKTWKWNSNRIQSFVNDYAATIKNRLSCCMNDLIWLDRFTENWAEGWNSWVISPEELSNAINSIMESALKEIYINYDIYTALNTIQILDNGEGSWLYRKYYAINIDVDSFYDEDKKICQTLCDNVQYGMSQFLQGFFEDEVTSLEE